MDLKEMEIFFNNMYEQSKIYKHFPNEYCATNQPLNRGNTGLPNAISPWPLKADVFCIDDFLIGFEVYNSPHIYSLTTRSEIIDDIQIYNNIDNHKMLKIISMHMHEKIVLFLERKNNTEILKIFQNTPETYKEEDMRKDLNSIEGIV